MVHGFLFGIGFLLAIAFFPTILRAAGVEIKIAIILLAGATAVVGLLWLVGSYQWIADIWIGIVILFWGALIGTWLVGEGRKKNYSPMLCVCGAVLAIGVATYYDGRSPRQH
jgi:hypothetical protein